MTGFTGSQDYIGTLSLRRRSHTNPHIPLKNRLRPSCCKFCAGCELFEVISNSHRTHNERVGVCFSVGCVGSSSETARSLRNPETWRTPSYMYICMICPTDNSLVLLQLLPFIYMKNQNQYNYVYFPHCTGMALKY